jgi:hypothetical protein
VATLPPFLSTLIPFLLVSAVIALVAWALQLMQAANDRREFSLMLAGCMVCSAAVGLATVMVITLTGPQRLAFTPLPIGDEAAFNLQRDSLPDSFVLPWDGQL